MMDSIMSLFGPIKAGKLFHISVIQDEPTAQVSEVDAWLWAVQLWSYRTDDSQISENSSKM